MHSHRILQRPRSDLGLPNNTVYASYAINQLGTILRTELKYSLSQTLHKCTKKQKGVSREWVGTQRDAILNLFSLMIRITMDTQFCLTLLEAKSLLIL